MVYVVIIDDRAFGPMTWEEAFDFWERGKQVDELTIMCPLYRADETNAHIQRLESAAQGGEKVPGPLTP